ncbi:MAG: UDP-N-acetylmuramate--L-alanine ligase [Rikenellaceae bacterium]|jgi:UDP-N-acetylmuramate--alanine ligase|nr:UDP-N-acetylmuramate--L-alanine ligase [Rikenellaceae bacterium]
MRFKNIYFLGIGGIGMSALARYFLGEGRRVGGYDLTETPLTQQLTAEGATIHYTEDVELIAPEFRDPATTLVVFTPAIPQGHKELVWFFDHGFRIEKRSEMLGHVSTGKFTMAVAGTHGKTTTTTLVAWLNRAVTGGGSAFLGGISKNFDSNLVLEPAQSTNTLASEQLSGQRLAVEADEFDRSFLRLAPDVAVITSVDADHLDIYGTYDAVREAFSEFIDKVNAGGAVVLNSKVDIAINNSAITTYSYSLDDPTTDFCAENIRPLAGGYYEYDIATPSGTFKDCRLGITGLVNVENSIAAVAMVWVAAGMRAEPLDEAKLREGLATFQGVSRRFDFYVNTPSAVYMDDYAHHPAELSATLTSLRAMFPSRHITAIFQPHLYTRTRDLYREFAEALSAADEVILVPIYPARELPIEGVGAEMIGQRLTVPWQLVEKERLAGAIAKMGTDVVVTFGAGNIADHCAEIAEVVERKVDKTK